MADNTTLPGTGEKIATDELALLNGATADAGLKVQRVKVGYGPDGSLQDVTGDAPLPVVDDALVSLLKLLIARVQPLSVITGAGSNRLSVDVNNIVGGSVNVAAITTVGTVANQAQIGGITAFALLHAASRTAFNTGTRMRL